MASPALPREGAWIGGVNTDGFAVQCRTDQDATLSVDLFTDKAMTKEVAGHSVTTVSVVTGQHWRGTAYVTGLDAGLTYYWRVNLDNAVDAITLGTLATFTAGRVKLADTIPANWSALFLGCTPWVSNTLNSNLVHLINHWGQVLAQDVDFHLHVDDVYYPDIGTQTAGYTDYAEGHFKNPATDADADVAAYRTNFINTYSSMPMSAQGSVIKTDVAENLMAKFKASCPAYCMPGDHDRAYDACSDRANAVGDDLARWNAGRDSSHELYMNLNKPLIDADTDSSGTGRTFTPYTSEDMYYVVDRPPVRFLVLDAWSHRNDNADVDTSSKLLFGTEQMAWVKARIDDNKQKYLVISFGSQLDGNHGFSAVPISPDNAKSFSYDRDVLMNYIYSNGNAGRTIFLAGDTHEAGVFRYDKDGNSEPIYEILSGNSGWIGYNHGFVNGLKTGASGFGCTMEAMFVSSMGFSKLEYKNGGLKVSLVLTKDTVSPNGHDAPKTVWHRTFK